RLAQTFGGVVVVMKMHFHFAKPLLAKRRDRGNVRGGVLLNRIEEGVLRRPAISIAVLAGDLWILIQPAFNPALCLRLRCFAISWLKMIGHAKQEMHLLSPSPRGALTTLRNISAKPSIH